jgi:hypothetical protein
MTSNINDLRQQRTGSLLNSGLAFGGLLLENVERLRIASDQC